MPAVKEKENPIVTKARGIRRNCPDWRSVDAVARVVSMCQERQAMVESSLQAISSAQSQVRQLTDNVEGLLQRMGAGDTSAARSLAAARDALAQAHRDEAAAIEACAKHTLSSEEVERATRLVTEAQGRVAKQLIAMNAEIGKRIKPKLLELLEELETMAAVDNVASGYFPATRPPGPPFGDMVPGIRHFGEFVAPPEETLFYELERYLSWAFKIPTHRVDFSNS